MCPFQNDFIVGARDRIKVRKNSDDPDSGADKQIFSRAGESAETVLQLLPVTFEHCQIIDHRHAPIGVQAQARRIDVFFRKRRRDFAFDRRQGVIHKVNEHIAFFLQGHIHALQLRGHGSEKLTVQIEADCIDVPALLRTENVSRAADLKVAQREFES